MILLNFSHPLTANQLAELEKLSGQKVERTLEFPVQFRHADPFAPQLEELMARIPLSSIEWQTEPIMIVPPALNFIAVALLAELHGRMGYFPPVVRLRPVEGSLPPRYEVAEVINLQEIRDQARKKR